MEISADFQALIDAMSQNTNDIITAMNSNNQTLLTSIDANQQTLINSIQGGKHFLIALLALLCFVGVYAFQKWRWSKWTH